MSGLKVGEVVVGSVRGIKPYGAFIDIGGVSGLLHISEISHDHIDTPHSVFNINDELKVMIIDLDADRGRISLSTKQLEPEAGDMLRNRQVVFERAEEMAEKYRQKLREEAEAAARGVEPQELETTAEATELSSEVAEAHTEATETETGYLSEETAGAQSEGPTSYSETTEVTTTSYTEPVEPNETDLESTESHSGDASEEIISAVEE